LLINEVLGNSVFGIKIANVEDVHMIGYYINQIEIYYEYQLKINLMKKLKKKSEKIIKIPTLKKDEENRRRIQYIYL
jgi:hypothetical protein